MDGVVVLLLKERHLERQYGEHLVNVALDVLYAPLLPGPYLRRDIVVDGNVGLGMHVFGNVEVEARIVDEYNHIWLPLHNVALAHGHIAEYSAQVHQYRYESHVGKFAVVFYTLAANSRH